MCRVFKKTYLYSLLIILRAVTKRCSSFAQLCQNFCNIFQMFCLEMFSKLFCTSLDVKLRAKGFQNILENILVVRLTLVALF